MLLKLFYTENIYGEPVVNGLFDPRMGVIDHGKICPTDNLDNRFCPSYFGHIELVLPVFQNPFIQLHNKKFLNVYVLDVLELLIDPKN